jgi:hypothetical protein
MRRTVNMNDTDQYPRLILDTDFGDKEEHLIEMKGMFDALIELRDGNRYEVAFYDSITLPQVMALQREAMPCFFEAAVVVIPEISIKAIRQVLPYLEQQGFFKLWRYRER